MAKLRFSDTVSQEDIDEALTLMSESQRSIIDQTEDAGPKRFRKDNQTQIFEIIKNACKLKGEISLEELEKKVSKFKN
jgi:DNA replicative helicase MCM subunit Mcm2 (Cdc46/Mcm family)